LGSFSVSDLTPKCWVFNGDAFNAMFIVFAFTD
jgi:hypothetical protein